MKAWPFFAASSVFAFHISWLPASETVALTTHAPASSSGDTIQIYLFRQVCAGEIFNGTEWQHDTLVTFFQPGTQGTDTLQIIEIDVVPAPEIYFAGDSVFCAGDTGTLSVPGFFSAYQWSSGASTQSIGLFASGDYGVTVTASNGCTAARTVTAIASMPDFALDFQNPACGGTPNGFIAASSFFGGIAPYEVSLNGGNFQSDTVFEHLSGGNYRLALRDAAGCTDSVEVTLTEPPAFTVDIGPDIFMAPGDTVRLSGSATNQVQTWTWQPAGLFDCAGCPAPLVKSPATATVTLTATDSAGCTATDELKLVYDPEIRLFVPNVFSPNNDGDNDLLLVFPGKGAWFVSEFLVFDRWGTLVFETDAPFQYPETPEWDGRSRGRPLLPGVYTWAALIRFPDGSEEARKGDITLIR